MTKNETDYLRVMNKACLLEEQGEEKPWSIIEKEDLSKWEEIDNSNWNNAIYSWSPNITYAVPDGSGEIIVTYITNGNKTKSYCF